MAVPSASSSCARWAAASATAAAEPSLPSAASQNPAATSRSTTIPGPDASRYPVRPPWMRSAPSAARSLLTSVAMFCSGAAGGSAGHRTSMITSAGTRAGRRTAISLSSVRDFRLPISASVSSVPSRTTLKVPARRSSTCALLAGPALAGVPTCTSYRWSGCGARPAVTRDEPAQDGRRPADVAAGGLGQDLVGLVRVEVAGVFVDFGPGAQAGQVELGVELGGIDVGADPEGLHRAPGRAGQQDSLAGQAADRLLVPGEGVKSGGQSAEQRILPSGRGQGDLDGADRLAVLPGDRGAQPAAECPDTVTGPEEREVGLHHAAEQAVQVRFHPALHRRLELVGVGVVERPAAEPDP